MIIVYHVQSHVIEVLKDFKIRSLSRYVTGLPSLVAIGTVSGDIIVYNSLSRDLKRPRNQRIMLMGRSS